MTSFRFGQTLRAAATLVALALSGCGGNSEDSDGGILAGGIGDSASCKAGYTACGGDLVGTWQYVDYCNPGVMLDSALGEYTSIEGCEDLVEDVAIDMGGTITFEADGTARREFAGKIDVVVRITSGCMTALGRAATADTMPDMCATLSASMSKASDSTTGACAMAGGDCLCSTSQSTSENANTSTTYAVSGNTLSLGTDTTNTYCVSGDTFTMAPADGTYASVPFIVMTRAN